MYHKDREDVQDIGHSAGCRTVAVPSLLPASVSLQCASLSLLFARANYGDL